MPACRKELNEGEQPPPQFKLFVGGKRGAKEDAGRAPEKTDLVAKALREAAAGSAPAEAETERRADVEAAAGAAVAVDKSTVKARLAARLDEAAEQRVGRGGRGPRGRRRRDDDEDFGPAKMSLADFEKSKTRVTLTLGGGGKAAESGPGGAQGLSRQEEEDRRMAEVRGMESKRGGGVIDDRGFTLVESHSVACASGCRQMPSMAYRPSVLDELVMLPSDRMVVPRRQDVQTGRCAGASAAA